MKWFKSFFIRSKDINKIEQCIYPIKEFLPYAKHKLPAVFIVGSVNKFEALVDKLIKDSNFFEAPIPTYSFTQQILNNLLAVYARDLTLVAGVKHFKLNVKLSLTYPGKFEIVCKGIKINSEPILLPSIEFPELDKYLADNSTMLEGNPLIPSLESIKSKITKTLAGDPQYESDWSYENIRRTWYIDLFSVNKYQASVDHFYKCASIYNDGDRCAHFDNYIGLSLLELLGQDVYYKKIENPYDLNSEFGVSHINKKQYSLAITYDERQWDKPVDEKLSSEIEVAFRKSKYWMAKWNNLARLSNNSHFEDFCSIDVFDRRGTIILKLNIGRSGPAGYGLGAYGTSKEYLAQKYRGKWCFTRATGESAWRS